MPAGDKFKASKASPVIFIDGSEPTTAGTPDEFVTNAAVLNIEESAVPTETNTTEIKALGAVPLKAVPPSTGATAPAEGLAGSPPEVDGSAVVEAVAEPATTRIEEVGYVEPIAASPAKEPTVQETVVVDPVAEPAAEELSVVELAAVELALDDSAKVEIETKAEEDEATPGKYSK